MKQGDLVAGRYRLLRRIGAGAMGTVWAARHEVLDREVALKLAVVEERGARPSRAARELFVREVQIVGKLRHPNIVECVDAGEAGDGMYLAMELLRGQSLAQRIARGPMTPANTLAVATGVCRALAAAHAAGIVHRDVKPENVFLAKMSSGGVVPKLLDFGVSSARGVATITPYRPFGTPAYMSPEQAAGERGADPRADLWAVGVVLYEMLTGKLPFAAPTYPALLPLIIEAEYPPLPRDVPAEVRTVVAGCLAKDKSDRYPTADALLEAIDRARAALPPPDLSSTRSGFFVEASSAGRPASPVLTTPDTAARTQRFGLAIAILAVPIAIGIAAIARGGRPPSAASRPPPEAAVQAPAVTAFEPAPEVVPASAAEPLPPSPPPSASASAAPDASAKAKPEAARPAGRLPRIRWSPDAP